VFGTLRRCAKTGLRRTPHTKVRGWQHRCKRIRVVEWRRAFDRVQTHGRKTLWRGLRPCWC
jgi:hypothetical protein